MTRLIITRHGYSEYNKSRQYTGQKDVPLTEEGIKQAEKSAEYVADTYKIDAIYSSDLIRAMNTARPLSERLGLPINKEPLLREIDAGLWQDLHPSEIQEKYPEDWKVYVETIGLARCTGGESLSELQERAIRGITRIAEENDGKTVFVATHGGVLLVLAAAWLSVPMERLHEVKSATNCSLTYVTYENGIFKIDGYSCDEHLSELKVANDMQIK